MEYCIRTVKEASAVGRSFLDGVVIFILFPSDINKKVDSLRPANECWHGGFLFLTDLVTLEYNEATS